MNTNDRPLGSAGDDIPPDVRKAIGSLDPAPGEIPESDTAWRRFKARRQGAQRPEVPHGRRSFGGRIRERGRLSLAVAGLAAAVAVIATVGPVREGLADLLSIFRVRSFAAVEVDRDRVEMLSSILRSEGEKLARPTVLRPAGEPRGVPDRGTAAAEAGFPVRLPAEPPAGVEGPAITVRSGPHLRFEFHIEQIRGALESVGLTDLELPPIPDGTVEVDAQPAVIARYAVPDPDAQRKTELTLIQTPSPKVVLPAGTDAQALGTFYLELLGLERADAERLAQEIDFTSTAVLPVPREVGEFREVEVDGGRGIFLRPKRNGSAAGALVWSRGGMIYSLEGRNVATSELLRVASTLR